MRLTSGCISEIYKNIEVKDPIVQVINIKKIPPTLPNQTDRYRLIISDGNHYMQGKILQMEMVAEIINVLLAMLATQWNHILAEDNPTKLSKNGITMLKKYITNSVHNRRIVIIVEVEVLIREMELRIGEPTNIEPNQLVGGGTLVNQRQDSFDNTTTEHSHASNMATATTTTTVSRPSSRGPLGDSPSLSSNIHSTATLRREEDGLTTSILPIKSINPYQNKWTIKARVANKSEIKTWRNAKGDGRLFSIDLIDDSGEIRATSFNDGVDRFYEMIEMNKVYYISKAQVKAAKRQYSSIRNEYELTLDNNSIVQLVSGVFWRFFFFHS
jgi:replication factor A1